MSTGPKTQNDITAAIKQIPRLLKWVGQLDEKLKNMPTQENVDLSLLEISIKNLDSKLSEINLKLKDTKRMSGLENQVAELTKNIKTMESNTDKLVKALDKKIIDLSAKITNSKKDNKPTTEPTEGV